MQDASTASDDRKRPSVVSRLLRSSVWLTAPTRKADKVSSVIDERHMWLAKRIAQGFGIADVAEVERLLTSKSVLDMVNRFFGVNSPRTLYCFCFGSNVDNLHVGFEPEEIGQGKVMYFVRTGDMSMNVGHNISEDLLVGECSASVIKSFSSTLHKVYVPMITAEKAWGTTTADVDRDFFSQLSRFSMTLTDVVQTLDSRVQLTRVDLKLLDTVRRSMCAGDEDGHNSNNMNTVRDTDTNNVTMMSSKEKGEGTPVKLIQGWEGSDTQRSYSSGMLHKEEHTVALEKLASEWKRAVEGFLSQEDPTLESLQDWGPDAPLVYWRERLAHLNALNEQFEASETKVVVGALTQARVCVCVCIYA
jgi:hypothetical protein